MEGLTEMVKDFFVPLVVFVVDFGLNEPVVDENCSEIDLGLVVIEGFSSVFDFV